jgi:hypothetical protein
MGDLFDEYDEYVDGPVSENWLDIDDFTDDSFFDAVSTEDPFMYLNERLAARKRVNETLENLDKQRLKEEIGNEESDWHVARYELQQFTNGGTPKGDGERDGEIGGPSAYEAWRYEMNQRKKTDRLKAENEWENNPYRSPRTTVRQGKLIDGQEDQFLEDYIAKGKNKTFSRINPKVESKLTEDIDQFLAFTSKLRR